MLWRTHSGVGTSANAARKRRVRALRSVAEAGGVQQFLLGLNPVFEAGLIATGARQGLGHDFGRGAAGDSPDIDEVARIESVLDFVLSQRKGRVVGKQGSCNGTRAIVFSGSLYSLRHQPMGLAKAHTGAANQRIGQFGDGHEIGGGTARQAFTIDVRAFQRSSKEA
jgi:hypothetical protein